MKSVVLHWYSKLLSVIHGKLKIDRFPVIFTATNVEKLSGFPELKLGFGFEICSAIYDTLQERSLLENVQVFVFDTIVSKISHFNSVCRFVKQKLGDILYLACRHRIYEIVL